MLLTNNARALIRVKSASKAELEAIFGVREAISGQVVGALRNQDTLGRKLCLLDSNPAGIVTGLKILSVLTGAQGAVLSVSRKVNGQELEANAGVVDLPLTIVEEELVDKRSHEEADLLVTLDELAALAAQLMGETTGILLAVDDEPFSELAPDTLLTDLVGEGKGILTDHRFISAAHLPGMTAADLKSVSGVIRTVTAQDCAVDLTAKELLELRKKSCGKCTFCREGLYQLSTAVEEITTGRAKPQDTAFLQEIGQAMTHSCCCSLGENAGVPVLSLLKEFGGEVDAHIRRKECPAEVCLALTQFYIDPALCKGEGKCAEVCPAGAITVKNGYVSVLDGFDCTRCGACLGACPQGAVKKVSGKLPKLPSRPVKIKGARIEAEEKSGRAVYKRRRVYAAAGKKAEKKSVTPKTVEKVQVNIVKTLQTDLVIIAGGPAGLAAAITAGEKGLKSIILEKSSTTGGAANMGMGPLGIDTKIQRANFNNISVAEALKLHMEYTHYNVDEDLVQTYFNKSADTIEWLQDMGVEFAGAFRYFKESAATWHIVKPENGVIGPRAASAMVKIMTERAKELGCEILLGTPATSLIQEDGKVVGAVAVDADGNGIEVRGKAVVVATGGFGNNKEMIAEEFNLHLAEDFFPFMIPGITGDGLRMMWDVGAAKFGANIEAIYQLPDNLNWFLLDAVLRQPNLLINQNGDRFMDEGMMGNTTFTGNALHLQPGNYGYCIMDEGILRQYKRNGPDIVDIVHPADAFIAFESQAAVAVEQGYPAYFESDTVEGLAEQIGIDPAKLQNTIDEYNEMCERGLDSKFHKNQEYLHPITGKGKYLCGKYYLAAYGTVGGVRINKYCEVLDENQMPIEGLYSAGSDANTIYGDSYNFTLCGNTMGFAVNTGRMAGESAAEYIADLG